MKFDKPARPDQHTMVGRTFLSPILWRIFPGFTSRLDSIPEMAGELVKIETIRAARERIDDVIYHSPCPYSLNLSRLCGCEIYCKLDHLQVTGSFKERGARNKLKLLNDQERRAGVIAVSAGNHGLGLAY